MNQFGQIQTTQMIFSKQDKILWKCPMVCLERQMINYNWHKMISVQANKKSYTPGHDIITTLLYIFYVYINENQCRHQETERMLRRRKKQNGQQTKMPILIISYYIVFVFDLYRVLKNKFINFIPFSVHRTKPIENPNQNKQTNVQSFCKNIYRNSKT